MWNHCVLFLILIFIVSLTTTESKRIKRVIGGVEVNCGSQVRVASLRNAATFRHLCGAVIISPKVALTAAHCVQKQLQYVLQLNNICASNNHTLPKAKVLEIIKYPLYNKYTRAHDIALMRIRLETHDTTLLELDTISILPNSSFGLSGECVVYGYGYTDISSKTIANSLIVAKLEIISLDKCTNILGLYMAPRSDSGMLCALGDGVDTCQGDSGGPIICEGKLQGISSYGLSCGVPGIPGVYTSIGSHLQWIQTISKYLHVR